MDLFPTKLMDFSINLNLAAYHSLETHSASNRTEYQDMFLGVKGGRRVKVILTAICKSFM
jgi:hypothetical protein